MKTKFQKLIETNYEYIFSEWKKCVVINHSYNGWTCSKQDEIKRLIFNSISLKSSYDIFVKLKLVKFFGKEYTEKLFDIFTKRNDYDLFQFIFDESFYDNETPNINTIKEIKKAIDEVLKNIDFTQNLSIYQVFYFRKEIKERNIDLSEIIHNLIGDENCISDGYENGDKLFSFSWHISKEKYIEIMDKITNFSNKNKLFDLMYFEIKKENSEPKIIGNTEIIKAYYC